MRDTFICNLYRKAREYEVLDINNSRKSFIRRNGRYMLSTLVALIVLFTLPCGIYTGIPTVGIDNIVHIYRAVADSISLCPG